MALIIRRFLEFISLILLLPLGLVFLSANDKSSSLDKIKASGSLIVLTVSGPTTYYTGPFGNAGYEYDLTKAFADFLGVDLVIKTADAFQDLLPMLSEGSADLAAAGITVTEGRKEQFKFGPVTEKITQQLIYRQGEKRPHDISQIRDDDIQVVAGKQYLSRLKTLKQEYPEVHWNKHQDSNSEALMHSVWQGRAEYAIANSNEVALTRLFYPELYVAFDLSGPMDLAWAFPNSEDTSLYDQAVLFFDSINADGTLRQIHNRYYGHVHHLGYVGKHTFMQQVYKRLPKYEAEFEQVAQKHKLDWRFLAALAYQESHWKPDAVSPTGVAGMMMLTEATAGQLKIKDRTNMLQSLEGGARYFNMVKQMIPKRIAEPDRTWLALAAYNIGYGHLEDSRIITQQTGGDPDKWVDIEKSLPLLTQKKWYSKAKWGYARGHEPVQYVRNIRTYFDLLVWFTEPKKQDQEAPQTILSEFAPSPL